MEVKQKMCLENPVEQEKLPDDIRTYVELCSHQQRSKGTLIAILHTLQERFGYLKSEHLAEVAKILNISLAKIMGVATFYHYFSLIPRGKHVISVCLGTACYVKGAGKLLARIEELLGVEPGGTSKNGLFSLNCTRCVGACAMAPVVIVDDKVYGNVALGQVPQILADYGFGEESATLEQIGAANEIT